MAVASAVQHLVLFAAGRSPAAPQIDLSDIDLGPGVIIELRDGEDLQFIRRRHEHELPYSHLLEALRVADAGDAQPARIGGSDAL